MINLHPTQTQLIEFADGTLSPAMALVVAAHCDMCPHCQEKLELVNAQLAEKALAEESESSQLPGGYSDMLGKITDLPVSSIQTPVYNHGIIELDGKTFKLPRALHRYIGKTGNWSHLVGKLWQAPVEMGDAGRANFIYMEKGGRVPEHTHKGSEITLVLDGEFSDGLSHYDTGDFIIMNDQHVHTPESHAEEGCLVFSIVDQPLHFTSGLARLLNPFSQLFF